MSKDISTIQFVYSKRDEEWRIPPRFQKAIRAHKAQIGDRVFALDCLQDIIHEATKLYEEMLPKEGEK